MKTKTTNTKAHEGANGQLGHYALKLSVFERLEGFISTEETRYYLNGVCLHMQGKEGRAVATDGHCMGIMTISKDDGILPERNIIVACKENGFLKNAKAMRSNYNHLRMTNYDAFVVLDTHKNRLALVYEAGPQEAITAYCDDSDLVVLTTSKVMIDGTFPEYKSVFPKDKLPMGDGVTVNGKTVKPSAETQAKLNSIDAFSFNTKLLARFGKAKPKELGNHTVGITLHFKGDKQGPCFVTLSGANDFVGIIMPMRCDNETLPSWTAGEN